MGNSFPENNIIRLVEIERKANEFGFNWKKAEQIIAQINSECEEIIEQIHAADGNSAHLQEEIGDLIHAVFSLCLFCELDPEETLSIATAKFSKRLQAVKKIAQTQGYQDLHGADFSTLMTFWDQAKAEVG